MSNKLFLIGINDYKHHNKLDSCIRDTEDFKDLLLEKFDFSDKDVHELFDREATSKNIQDAFTYYIGSLSESDNLIIYFSGHGSYNEETDIGYWVPVEGSDYTTWLSNETIILYLERLKCKHIFLISDSCFSNSLLIRNKTKTTSDYYDYRSRWALTSAFGQAMDSDKTSNTLFAEGILNYLEKSESDIRVSELIEEVKRYFLANKLQKPQGYPLLVNGHMGGEFVFKIKQGIDKRKFKGYLNFEKILKLYKRNSIFSKLSIYEDRTNKIGYQLFQEVDSVIKKATYYLYLYEGIIQSKTLKHLKEHHSEIFLGKNLVLFIPIEREQIDLERRKKNIQEKFKPISLFYIDDFIRTHCTPKMVSEDDSKFLNISNFILPLLDNSGENDLITNYFSNWYYKANEPILLIKGSGGIGKTTLAQYFADKILTNSPNNYVLFIDSIQIKDSLLKNKNRDNLNLYNFYEAAFDVSENTTEKLSEDLFKLNLDAGNILIIIDGLDEVISKIPNFNVSEFLRSIKSSSNELGSGKVIITCRSYFWDASDFDVDEFGMIELEPFIESQALEFFKKSFGSENWKVKKALKLSSDFKYPGTEKDQIYHPYVLDIIRSIVENENETLDLDLTELNSTFLRKEIKNDYITYRVCDRERKRVGQINVDEQIKFFIYFAIEKRGLIRTFSFKNEIETCLDKKVDRVNVEAFKSHPFLKHYEATIVFRYDFLADLFKSIYLSTFFDYKASNNLISKSFIDTVNESCWFGSALNNDIVNRINHWNDDDILLASDVINQIRGDSTLKKDIINKVIANIFNLCLTINHKFKSNNIENNTILLRNLFETKSNTISGLCIININSDQNIRFDLSDLSIIESIIDSYSNFWKCNFTINTKFINCELLNIKFREGNTLLNKNNFIDCTSDKEVESTIKQVEQNGLSKVESIKSFLSDFFHLFLSNGRIGRQWEDKIIIPRFSGINKPNIDYKKLIRSLKKHQIIIVSIELGRNKFIIEDNCKENIFKFIKDGTVSKEISLIVNDLMK